MSLSGFSAETIRFYIATIILTSIERSGFGSWQDKSKPTDISIFRIILVDVLRPMLSHSHVSKTFRPFLKFGNVSTVISRNQSHHYCGKKGYHIENEASSGPGE